MPALFPLAQHAALSEAAAWLQQGDAIFAFLDDTYMSSKHRSHRCAARRPAYGMPPVKSLPASPVSKQSVQSYRQR